ncbi:neprilysin-2-like [Amblyomma americanum]
MSTLQKVKKRRTGHSKCLTSHVNGKHGEVPASGASAVAEDKGRREESVSSSAEATDRHQKSRSACTADLPLSEPISPNAVPESQSPEDVTALPKAPFSPVISSSQEHENVSAVSKPVSPADVLGSPAPYNVTAVSMSASPAVASPSQQPDDIADIPKPVSIIRAPSLNELDDVPSVAQPAVPSHHVSLDEARETSRLAQSLQRMETKATVFLCCLFLIFLCIVIALLQSKKGRGEGGRLCASQDCRAHRMLFQSVLDKSVDPCEDFGAFVCPHHEQYSKEPFSVDAATTTLPSMYQRWLDGLQKLIEDGAKLLGAARKAAAMYNGCMTQDRSTNDSVTHFMEMLGLRRLEPREPETSAFGVLLDIAYNWQAPLWFRVAVLPSTTFHPVLRVLISRNPLMAEWQAQLQAINGTQEYRKRWSETMDVRANDRVISRHLKTRMNIFRMFLNTDLYGTRVPRHFSLADASNHANFASNMTLLLHQHIKSIRNFTRQNMIIFEEARLLEASNAAFTRYDNSELLQLICWLFRDVYGPIADPSRAPSHSVGPDTKTRLRYCSFVVETSNQLLVNALFAVSRLTPDERESIDGLLRSVQQAAVQLMRDADWLEWRSLNVAIAKLEDIETLIWPRNEHLTDGGLFNFYRFFPDRATSISAYLVQTREAIRKYIARGPQECAELLGAPGSYAEPLFSYSHVMNAVHVSMAALSRPLFYGSGTQAMLYGGLGYQYTRELVRDLDSIAVQVVAHGSVKHRWLSRAPAAEYSKRATCLGAVNLFPETPALEVAYTTYLKATGKQAEEEPKLFMKMTEAQVLFITMCLGMCHQQRVQSARVCNKAIMGFRPFAEAFHCDAGSNMSVLQKCGFFQ